MNRIPCTIWMVRRGRSHPIWQTKTYWGAKRMKKKLDRLFPEREFIIHEIWNRRGNY